MAKKATQKSEVKIDEAVSTDAALAVEVEEEAVSTETSADISVETSTVKEVTEELSQEVAPSTDVNVDKCDPPTTLKDTPPDQEHVNIDESKKDDSKKYVSLTTQFMM